MPFVRWLRRVLGWSRDQSPDVFEYHDGRRRVRCQVIGRFVELKALLPELGSLLADLAIWQHEAKRAGEMLTPGFDSGCRAFVRIVSAVRESFGLVPSDRGGPNDAAVFGLLDDFLAAVGRRGQLLGIGADTTEKGKGA